MMNKQRVPAALAERFLPHEGPAFNVVCERGAVRLWRSIHRTTIADGGAAHEITRFHVSEGDEVAFMHMRELWRAEANFAGITA
jgi:hypothetical protein